MKYREEYIKLIDSFAVQQVESFHRGNETYINMLVKSAPMRYILITIYRLRVGLSHIKPVQSLPEEEKKQLWEQTKFYADNRLGKIGLIDLSISLYTLECLL